MDNNINNQVALVTGGAQRLGAAMTKALHAADMRVVIHCRRSTEAADALAAQCNALRTDSARVVRGDLLDMAQLQAVAQAAESAFGELHCLINNASSFYPTAVGTITAMQWDDLMGTNLRAPLFLTQALAPALSKSRGCVINMTDYYAEHPLPDHALYCVAKAGVIGMTRALAKELAPDVRVNAIAPGAILWPEGGLAQAQSDEILGRTALGRRGDADDIARAALYLVRDAAFVTGQVLPVNGGRD
jgi:pteridine reductase